MLMAVLKLNYRFYANTDGLIMKDKYFRNV